jgi:predicted secreted protein
LKGEKKMKKTASGITIAILLIGMLTLAFNIQQAKSSEPPVLEWDRTYGGADHDGAYCLVQTDDGGYALAGYTLSFGAGSYDIWLVKTDSVGNMQWNQTYGGAREEGVHSLVQTGDGGYVLAGTTESFGAGGYDFWLVKTYANGSHQWNQTYGGTQDDAALSMIRTEPDGGYALAGKTRSFGAGAEDFWLVKTDSNGNMEWNQTYGEAYDDWAFALLVTYEWGFLVDVFWWNLPCSAAPCFQVDS